MASYLSINGVKVTAPQKFTYTLQTIDGESSGRNASGTMVRDIIAKKVKLEANWGPLSDAEVSEILTKVSSSFFTVTYPDPETGSMTTKTFYVGDRTAPSYSWSEKLKALKWQGLSMNFIER